MKPDSNSKTISNTTNAVQSAEPVEKQFHGWRLLAVIFGVVTLIAIGSFIIDWKVIGPLDGRSF